MSTPAIIQLVNEGVTRTMYVHWDGYASQTGKYVLTYGRALAGDPGQLALVRVQTAALVDVNSEGEPDEQELELIGKRYWMDVDTGKNWYAYLRKTQGDIPLMLESGYICDESNPYWEYAWRLDLDERRFSGWIGTFNEPPVIEAGFDALPTDAELLDAFGERG